MKPSGCFSHIASRAWGALKSIVGRFRLRHHTPEEKTRLTAILRLMRNLRPCYIASLIPKDQIRVAASKQQEICEPKDPKFAADLREAYQRLKQDPRRRANMTTVGAMFAMVFDPSPGANLTWNPYQSRLPFFPVENEKEDVVKKLLYNTIKAFQWNASLCISHTKDHDLSSEEIHALGNTFFDALLGCFCRKVPEGVDFAHYDVHCRAFLGALTPFIRELISNRMDLERLIATLDHYAVPFLVAFSEAKNSPENTKACYIDLFEKALVKASCEQKKTEEKIWLATITNARAFFNRTGMVMIPWGSQDPVKHFINHVELLVSQKLSSYGGGSDDQLRETLSHNSNEFQNLCAAVFKALFYSHDIRPTDQNVDEMNNILHSFTDALCAQDPDFLKSSLNPFISMVNYYGLSFIKLFGEQDRVHGAIRALDDMSALGNAWERFKEKHRDPNGSVKELSEFFNNWMEGFGRTIDAQKEVSQEASNDDDSHSKYATTYVIRNADNTPLPQKTPVSWHGRATNRMALWA